MGAFADMSPRLGSSVTPYGSAYAVHPYEPLGFMTGGGFWGTVGSSLKSGLTSMGNMLTSGFNYGVKGLKQFGNSDTWKDIKAGVKESGVIQNLGQIGANSLNSLIDIANVKAQMGVERMKYNALGLPDPYGDDEWARWRAISSQAVSQGQAPPVPPRAPPRGSSSGAADSREKLEDPIYDTILDGVYGNVGPSAKPLPNTEDEIYQNYPVSKPLPPLPPPPNIPLPLAPHEVRPRPSIPESPYFNDVYELDPAEFDYDPETGYVRTKINPMAGSGPRWKRALRDMTGGLARKRRRYCR